jgi:cytochrome P450
MLPYLAHHSEQCWEAPERFRPQRFDPKPQVMSEIGLFPAEHADICPCCGCGARNGR